MSIASQCGLSELIGKQAMVTVNGTHAWQAQAENSLTAMDCTSIPLAFEAQRSIAWLQDPLWGIHAAANAYYLEFDKRGLVTDGLIAAMEYQDSVLSNQANQRTFLEHGWVLPIDASAQHIEHIVELFSTDPDQANDELCEMLDARTDFIRNYLVSRFPNRAAILDDAFDAHKTGKYNLSIPVFLSQADGMWKERCGRNLSFDELTKNIETLIQNSPPESLTRQLFLALSHPQLPLYISESKRPSGFSALNRHQVLHGESLDYGTRLYSCQAMAFLDYCGTLLPDPNAGRCCPTQMPEDEGSILGSASC